MDHYSLTQPLVLSRQERDVTKKSLIVLSAKWILKATMWLIFLSWAALIFANPTSLVDSFFNSWIEAIQAAIFGPSGQTFLFISAPLLAIAILSVPYLMLRENHEEANLLERRTTKKASISLWTFPVLVNGVFGVVSAAEFIGILVFCVYVVWSVAINTNRTFGLAAMVDLPPRELSIYMLELQGRGFGNTAIFLLAVLFLPIARGSVLLRLVDIPVQRATQYHIWLGHLTLFFFTIHGICYLTGWTLDGILYYQILDWKEAGMQNFAGVTMLITGLVMWVTSLGFVRRWSFEFFYYTHHLYAVFVVLFVLHVGDYHASYISAGVFLFMLDRFLRFCQSKKTVDVVSARSFSCGAVELVLSKPKNLSYNALSFVFIQIQEISWLQWHPFSVSSSPLGGKYHLSVLIKGLGSWTHKLNQTIENISNQDNEGQYLKLKARVEGPYGHQVQYHLKYENLILIAGGIGISPFLAILSDILHRVKQDKLCLPKNIILIWAVKTANEIPLLSMIGLYSVPPSLFLKLDLHIHIYVTRQQSSHLEEGAGDHKTVNNLKKNKGNGMSVLAGSGNIMWSGTYLVVSTIGLVVLVALFDGLYMNPHHIASVYKGYVILVCSFLAVILFGGCVIGFWNSWETETVDTKESTDSENGTDQSMCESNLPASPHTVIEYGSRPDFKEVLANVSKQWGHVDVGVIVCGPSSLESSIAREIRSHNFRRETNHPVFHFHGHSFQL